MSISKSKKSTTNSGNGPVEYFWLHIGNVILFSNVVLHVENIRTTHSEGTSINAVNTLKYKKVMTIKVVTKKHNIRMNGCIGIHVGSKLTHIKCCQPSKILNGFLNDQVKLLSAVN